MSPKKISKSEENLSELEILKQQMADLQNKLSLTQNKEVREEDIKLDRVVKIMNGYRGILNLPRGNGREELRFNEFGEIRRVQYSQLLEIIERKEDFFKRGWFYILDRDIVEKLGYGDLNILTKEQIERVIDSTCSTENAYELYQSGTESQKAVIVDALIEYIRDGKDTNQNLVRLIEKDSKVKIMERAEQAKEYMAIGVP